MWRENLEKLEFSELKKKYREMRWKGMVQMQFMFILMKCDGSKAIVIVISDIMIIFLLFFIFQI